MKRLVYGLAAVALLLPAAGRARAEYIVTDLGTLGGDSYAHGINDSGQVVGQLYPKPGVLHAFLYSGGKMTDLGTLPGHFYSLAYGINDSGQVVGVSGGRAFLYSGGKMTDLGIEGPAYAINNSGQVVGYAGYPFEGIEGRAFLYSNGKVTDLGALVGPYSHAYGINDSGKVVGTAVTANSYRAFLYSGGKMTDLSAVGGPGQGMLDARAINASGQVAGQARWGGAVYSDGKITYVGSLGGRTIVEAINDAGQVVGYSSVKQASGQYLDRAFFYSDGKMTNLNSLIPADSGWVLKYATGINNTGQIIGRGSNPRGEHHAFLLTPVDAPEPGSLTLVGLGALGLAGYAWRKRSRARA